MIFLGVHITTGGGEENQIQVFKYTIIIQYGE